MKTLPIAIASVAFAAAAIFLLPGLARALSVGDAAPDFTADSALAGQSVKFSLKDALAKHAVVLYFFPQAFTSG